MRGQKENACFTAAKKVFCSPKQLSIRDEIKKRSLLTDEDMLEVEKIFQSAIPNQEASVFPDFVFQDGFIEHFQITSSKENRKGSLFVKESQEFYRNAEKEIDQKIENLDWEDEKVGFQEIWKKEVSGHNIEYLHNSFKKNWKKHMTSLQQYNGPKKVGVFLIEYSDRKLDTYDGNANTITDGYDLIKDAEMLQYISKNRDKIKYVFFVEQYNSTRLLSIVKTEYMENLIKLCPSWIRFENLQSSYLTTEVTKIASDILF